MTLPDQILGIPIPAWPLGLWLLGAAALVLALALLWLGWRLKRWRDGWRVRRNRLRGARGERDALALIRRAGFAILDEQVPATGIWRVDGRDVPYDIRADAIVKRRGRRYVAEVKTGAAADLSKRETRRQLLEYAYIFRLDGVLLVDMEAREIHEVRFPGLRR